MSLNNISFVKGKGGLGRPLAGKDYISSLLFYIANGSLPSGFSTSVRNKAVFSVAEAESLGILNNNNDETQATGVYTISTLGANGDSITIKFLEPNGTDVTLGSFVKTATETTVTLLATALTASINAGFYTHGYSATNTAGAITVTCRKGFGVYPNSGTPLTAVISGTVAGSVTTAFSGGVASNQTVWHYHISEFFRLQPKGKLWLGFYAVPSTYTFSEIQTIQQATNGEIRQLGVFVNSTANTSAHTTSIQAICDTLDGLKMPLSVVLGGNIVAVSDLTTLTDLQTLSNNKVSVVIGQDGAGIGFELFKATGKSVTTLGATLGAIAFANVQEDIAWVGKFNLSNGVELETIVYANGNASTSVGLDDSLDVKRYIFCRKFPNLAGSYFNDSHTAISQSSDYAYIENNRVIDKAIRGVDEALLPSLNSPLLLNANGTLANSTIAFLESQAVVITNDMVRNSEASAIGVSIDPNQNVATTSTVYVTIDIVPVGVARNIIVNIGFKTSL